MGSLVASAGTLLCCVLPAVMVSIGAGATLMALVSSYPQLVWLSEHKGWVFLLAAALLLVGGILIWRARYLPCPLTRLPRASAPGFDASMPRSTSSRLLSFGSGALFAYLLPVL